MNEVYLPVAERVARVGAEDVVVELWVVIVVLSPTGAESRSAHGASGIGAKPAGLTLPALGARARI